MNRHYIPDAYLRILGLAVGFGATLFVFVVSYSPGVYLPVMHKGSILVLVLVVASILAMYFARMRKMLFAEGVCIGFIVATMIIVAAVWGTKTGVI